MTPNQPTNETMSEGSPEMELPEAATTTDTVPLDVLAMPDDETEQMTPPAVGDEVNYSVTGKVTAINGGVATVQRTAINGKELGDTTPDDDEAGLQAQASQMDADNVA